MFHLRKSLPFFFFLVIQHFDVEIGKVNHTLCRSVFLWRDKYHSPNSNSYFINRNLLLFLTNTSNLISCSLIYAGQARPATSDWKHDSMCGPPELQSFSPLPFFRLLKVAFWGNVCLTLSLLFLLEMTACSNRCEMKVQLLVLTAWRVWH